MVIDVMLVMIAVMVLVVVMMSGGGCSGCNDLFCVIENTL